MHTVIDKYPWFTNFFHYDYSSSIPFRVFIHIICFRFAFWKPGFFSIN